MSTAVSFADAERAYLCDLLERLGPDAPTLCAGWTSTDLAAHLVTREARPDAGPGMVLPLLAAWTARVQQGYRRREYSELVSRIRKGPPLLSPFSVPGVAALADTFEYFVHHEDLRRAQAGWEPRELDGDVEDLLWSRLARQGRLMFRRAPVGVILGRPDGQVHTARAGGRRVRIIGQPSELTLYAFGRRDHARVQLEGDAQALSELKDTAVGI